MQHLSSISPLISYRASALQMYQESVSASRLSPARTAGQASDDSKRQGISHALRALRTLITETPKCVTSHGIQGPTIPRSGGPAPLQTSVARTAN
jgi:hypothetical protein